MTTELLTDPSHSRADLAMVETAIRKGWQIPEQLLEALPRVAGAMALKGKPRDQIRAIEVILRMKEQNEKSITTQKSGRSQTINVGVNVANVSDTGRSLASEILARLGTDGVSEVTAGSDADRRRSTT